MVPMGAAAGGVTAVITGFSESNITLALLIIEFTVTVNGPHPADTVLGTTATICESLQLVIEVAGTPLNINVLPACVAPKYDPEMVTEVPTPAFVGETLAM